MKNKLPKIIVILGPTASGKTDLSLSLAKKYNGEVVSADSRQVYKKMDIGTAKTKGEWTNKKRMFVVDGIPHHLIDIVNPDIDFSLADFKKMAIDSINDILDRDRIPIVVGGTGLYIWALVDNLDIPKTQPDNKLRAQLETKSLAELVSMLTEKDPDSAKIVDLKNPRRVIRALEVVMSTGQSFFDQRTKSSPLFEVLQIGLDVSKEDLFIRINERVDKQIEAGLVEEVRHLVSDGYSWNLPSMSGIGYRQIGLYLKGEKTLAESIEILKQDTRQYAKRQMTWFKRDKRICWVKNIEEAEKLVEQFIISN